MEIVEWQFKPEFINRIDELVVFHPLGKPQSRAIAKLQIAVLRSRLLERGIDIEVSDNALDASAKRDLTQFMVQDL